MVVSRKKAKLTQNKRFTTLQSRQLELFDYSSIIGNSLERKLLKVEYINETIFHYPSLKQRTIIKAPKLCETGSIYQFCTQRALKG